jgi:cytochrome d ubiquinol oxidase subunit II
LLVGVVVLVLGVLVGGVGLVFRFKATRARTAWGVAFALGSMFAAFAQGVILGALVEGMPLNGGKYLQGAFGWFSPFSMLTGVAVVFGYALLGSTWLILKTEGRMQLIARNLTRPLVLVVVAFMGLVSAWLPFLDSRIMARWFEGGHFWWLAPVPVLALANAFLLWRAVMREGRDAAPFVLTLCFFALGFAGLVLGIWPNIVPPSLSIWEAASPPSSQGFVLAGLVVLLPAILGYTYWSYSVFRGKVAADAGYH